MDKLQLQLDVYQALRHSFIDEAHLERLLRVLTSPPLYTTLRIDENAVDLDKIIRTVTPYLSKQCEEYQRQDYEMQLHPLAARCLVIKNRGPQNIKKEDKTVVVDMACGMAVLRGAHVYKQGIMGAPHSLKAGELVSVYADLEGKCLKGLAADYEGKKLHVGNGISMVSRADLFNLNSQENKGLGILMTQPLYEAPSLSDIPLDWISPQNLPSIIAVYALNPWPGEIVLDMCAAPGGKTAHIADKMGHEGRVVALEKSKERAEKMKEKVKSKCVEIYAFDSTKAVDSAADKEGGPPYPPATFDRVLVDAPCSALGQRPCYVNNMSLNQLKSYPVIQHKLLLAAEELLKPGGTLLYSTCTITREENEDQVSRLMAKCPSLILMQSPSKVCGDGLPGCDLTEEQRSAVLRFDPSVRDNVPAAMGDFDLDTIGFFIAKFHKKCIDKASIYNCPVCKLPPLSGHSQQNRHFNIS